MLRQQRLRCRELSPPEGLLDPILDHTCWRDDQKGPLLLRARDSTGFSVIGGQFRSTNIWELQPAEPLVTLTYWLASNTVVNTNSTAVMLIFR